MKKKTGIILAVVLLLAAAICALVIVKMRPSGSANPSRRDDAQLAGAATDEDLSAVTGDEVTPAATQTPKDNTGGLTESIVEQDANKPLSDDVETVREISLNEAVVMGEGDIGTFYSDEEYKDVVPVDISSFSASLITALEAF